MKQEIDFDDFGLGGLVGLFMIDFNKVAVGSENVFNAIVQ
jgi:hypothetical protein